MQGKEKVCDEVPAAKKPSSHRNGGDGGGEGEGGVPIKAFLAGGGHMLNSELFQAVQGGPMVRLRSFNKLRNALRNDFKGFGMIAGEEIKKGVRIANFDGGRVDESSSYDVTDVVSLQGKGGYIIRPGKLNVESVGWAINSGQMSFPPVTNNAKIVATTSEAYVLSTRKINKGEEIYTSYGRSYPMKLHRDFQSKELQHSQLKVKDAPKGRKRLATSIAKQNRKKRNRRGADFGETRARRPSNEKRLGKTSGV